MSAWLQDLGLAATFGIFAAAAFGVWRSGAALSRYADSVAERTAMGRAFAGVLLLGVATSLPELATTSAAAVGGHPVLAGTNLLGGVAMQMVILAVIDGLALRGKSLSHVAADPSFLMQGVVLIALMGLACAAVATGEPFSVLGVGFWPLLLGSTYLLALLLMYRYEQRPRWQPVGVSASEPAVRHPAAEDDELQYRHLPLRGIFLRFAVASIVVLVTGYLVAETGAEIAARTGIGENVIGPRSSPSRRRCPSSARPSPPFGWAPTVWPSATSSAPTRWLSRCSCPRTCSIGRVRSSRRSSQRKYCWGFLASSSPASGSGVPSRRPRTFLGMGIDSVIVVFVYAGGLAFYYGVAT